MGRYRRLVKDIRKKSFPEIKGFIWIIKIPFPIPGASIMLLLPRLNLLAFSTACRKLNKKVMVGLVAHELSHFSIHQRKSWVEFWKFYFTATKKQSIRDERKTDKLAIRKGYGKEMIATKTKAIELLEGTKYEKKLDNYMSVKEVKDYIKKISLN